MLLVLVGIRQPDFLDPPSLMSFLGRSAPIILLAAGQYFVIVSGEFDLSVGSLVTAQVVVAARLIDSDPARPGRWCCCCSPSARWSGWSTA